MGRPRGAARRDVERAAPPPLSDRPIRVLRPASHTLPDLLDELAARQPEHELIVDATGRVRLGYAEARARARRLARGLVRLGVRRGDRVALLMTNRPEWLLDRLRGDAARRGPGADQHLVAAARARVRARPLRGVGLAARAALREPGLPGRARRHGRRGLRAAAASPAPGGVRRRGGQRAGRRAPVARGPRGAGRGRERRRASTPPSGRSPRTTWRTSSTPRGRRRLPRGCSSPTAG